MTGRAPARALLVVLALSLVSTACGSRLTDEQRTDALSAGGPVGVTFVATAPSLLEEISGNQELQLYAQWLNQVEPGASPTGIGQYAWAAARLFVEKAKKVGPKLTRKALLAEMPSVRAYDGNGLFPKQDVGGRTITDCTAVVQVKGGKFVRYEPAARGADRCGDGVWDSKTNKIIKRG